jgi:two-component system chemotaxis response regulator CheB
MATGRDSQAKPPLFCRRNAPDSHLTELGCPDCRGVLSVTIGHDSGRLAFACRVGHRFSEHSLMAVKEDQLEDALWTAVELYEEIALLHEALAARDSGENAAAQRDRAARAAEYAATIRELIQRDGQAAVERDVSDPT